MMHRRLGLAIACALFAVAPLGARADDPTPLTGPQIYLRAVRAMHDLPRPKFATYTLDIDTKNLSATCDPSADHDDIAYDFKLGSHHGHYAIKQNLERDVSTAEDQQTHKRCANSTFAPIMSYDDDAYNKKPKQQAGDASSIGKDGTKIIGRVTAESVRDYIVTLRGHATIDGHDTYVLNLEPRHAAEDEPFREMHVDAQNFRIRDLRGNVVENESGVHVRVDIGLHCIDAGDYFVISEVSANTALRWAIFPMHVDIDFHAHDFAFPATLEIATASK